MLAVLSVFFAAAPAEAGYTYEASLTVTPMSVLPGAAETLTYHVIGGPCPSGPARFFMDATAITTTAPMSATTCSATAHYTVPRSIQCGQHEFEGDVFSATVPAVGYLFMIPCPKTPGGIVWGSASGSAIVHKIVSIGAPRVPYGALVRYYWKLKGKYTTIHTPHYTFPWSSVGTYVYGVVRVDENLGSPAYWRFYRFGPVKP